MEPEQGILSYAPNQPYNVAPGFQSPATILEPADYDSENGSLRLVIKPFSLPTNEFGNPHFINSIALLPIGLVSYSARKYDWSYGSRHQAQSVLPFLYLGPASAARDVDFVQKNGITMVIAVRSAQAATMRPKLLQPSRFPACEGLKTMTFDIDNPYDFITRMKPVLKQMNDHLEVLTGDKSIGSPNDIKGKILVICESGNERSPALVAAYLMLIYGLSWRDAVNFIHAHRFSISLNSSMNDMLRTWEGIITARSDTALVEMNAIEERLQKMDVKKSSKRTVDDAYDDMEDEIEEETFETRPGIAPFRDTNLQPMS